jgi:hypothetical protein
MKLKLNELNPKLRDRIAKQMANEDSARGQKSRPCTGVQKQETGDTGQPNRKNANTDRTKNCTVDGAVHPKFRITVVLKFSDQRRRDGDGAYTTILDCLIIAARRFKAVGIGIPHLLRGREQGK